VPNDDNDLFREVTLRLCGSLDLGEALSETFAYLRQRMPLQGISLAVYDGKARSLRMLVMTTLDYALKDPFAIPLSDEGRRAAEEILALDHGRTRLISRGEVHPLSLDILRGLTERFEPGSAVRTMLEQNAPHSLLIADLVLSGQRLGQAAFIAPEVEAFTQAWLRMIETLKAPFAIAVSNFLRHEETVRLKNRLAQDNQELQHDLLRRSGDRIVGASGGLREVMHLVRQVAPLDSPVLIQGETGTGKEVLANSIHRLSPRCTGPMISVNCGALNESLLDSELFGHEKGAFTGAVSRKRGRFERADQGTIFLDEVAELSPSAQVKLLRVLQTKTLERVGGTEPIEVDVRIIAATHRNVQAMIEDGSFRQDLWFRLNVFPVTIPPLRERKEDIPLLVRHFLEKKAGEMKRAEVPELTAEAMEQLCSYDWPGNVRELENVIERGLILSGHGHLAFPGLIEPHRATSGQPDQADKPPVPLDQAIAEHIRKALRHSRGRIEGPFGAARILGLNPSTLKGKMRRLGIRRSEGFSAAE